MVLGSLFSFQKITIMSFHKLKALVVEDEEKHRNALIEALNESLDIEVVGMATSVNEAFDLVKNTPADLLFLDIMLIGGDAFQLISLLKRQQVSIPPIVIQTGRGTFEHGERIHNEFKDDVLSILQKPFYENWEKKRDAIIDAIYVKNQAARFENQVHLPKNLVIIQDGRHSFMINTSDVVMVKTGPKGQGKTEIMLEHQPYKAAFRCCKCCQGCQVISFKSTGTRPSTSSG